MGLPGRTPAEAVLDALETLGVRLAQRRQDGPGITLVGSDHMSPAELFVSLAAQLAAGAEAKAPVCSFIRQQRGARGVDAFGAIRLEHLEGYRAAYGAARDALIRQALHEVIERVLRQRAPHDGIAWVGLEGGAVFSGTQTIVDAVLDEVGQAYPPVARLHYRKLDRDQGFVDVAGEEKSQFIFFRFYLELLALIVGVAL